MLKKYFQFTMVGWLKKQHFDSCMVGLGAKYPELDCS
jgi:hypothetical protein